MLRWLWHGERCLIDEIEVVFVVANSGLGGRSIRLAFLELDGIVNSSKINEEMVSHRYRIL